MVPDHHFHFDFSFGNVIHIITTRAKAGEICASGLAPVEFCQEGLIGSYVKMFSVVSGDVSLSDFEYLPGITLIFALFCFFGIIVLVNVLIAIVSDSYKESVVHARQLFGRARVSFAVTHISRAVSSWVHNAIQDGRAISVPHKGLGSYIPEDTSANVTRFRIEHINHGQYLPYRCDRINGRKRSCHFLHCIFCFLLGFVCCHECGHASCCK